MEEVSELWRPGAQRVGRSRLRAFTDRCGLPEDYASLHRWSIEQPDSFWRAVWEFFELQGELGPHAVLPAAAIRETRFLPEARLSYPANLLRGDPAAPAAISCGEDGVLGTLTRGELAAEVARMAAALRGCGIGPGSRVAGVVANTPEALIAMLATLATGAAWSSCSPDFGVPAIADRLGQVRPQLVVACAGYRYKGRAFDIRPKLAELANLLEPRPRLVVHPYAIAAGDLPAGAEAWDDFMARGAGAELDCLAVGYEDPGLILFSSGTTGKPKCIVHSAAGLLLKHCSELGLHCDIGPGDRLLYFTTCGWMMWNWQASALALGAAVVLYDGNPFDPDPGRLPRAISEHGVTHFGASAKYFAACEKAGLRPFRGCAAPALRTLLSTGSPLLPGSFDYIYENWGADLHLASISGGTDICGCFVGGVPTEPVRRGRIQAAQLGCDVAAYDAQGKEVAGVPGELVCRNALPSMPLGFLDDADGARLRAAYFEKHPGVWSHGDWAVREDDGSFVITGRSDATLNPGGVRIGTAEIYRVVERLAAVEEALAVGQEADGDERIILFVRLAAGAALDAGLAEEIRRSLREQASARHVPHRIHAVAEFPLTRSGKLAELAVKAVVNGREAASTEGLANPAALARFAAAGRGADQDAGQ
ncbi:MAG: acetoacetate--CoA ligase [Betaproteobacteria bacterium AqS2]|uniref:Acetoacetate--CoA ligase n=1 Tax=Candidatus Amphirhobacter heronislandensis TaxID=1732024 RepID=A0A930Y386_9GAMM|nr:acetoacetate--CoA ligase [Betaproteobacteria bacterium AqS2]